MQTDKERLELFMLRYKELRQAQNTYFKNKNDVNMRLAKAKEGDCDALYKQLLREGYNPENQNISTTQKNLFNQ